jgi:recombinational DNA repair protein (RecF pathway)
LRIQRLPAGSGSFSVKGDHFLCEKRWHRIVPRVVATVLAASGLGLGPTTTAPASAVVTARAGSPDVKNVPDAYVEWIRRAAVLCDEIDGPLLAAQIEQESN